MSVENEVIPEIVLRGQRWILDDRSASSLEPGRCFAVRLVLRADGIWEFRDGKRWKVTLLEIEGIEA